VARYREPEIACISGAAAARHAAGAGLAMARQKAILGVMDIVFVILIGLAMLATLGVLFMGVFGMARRGGTGGMKSNKLMQWRVILQGLALLLFVVFMLLSRR
jgi:hypothetical protein